MNKIRVILLKKIGFHNLITNFVSIIFFVLIFLHNIYITFCHIFILLN